MQIYNYILNWIDLQKTVLQEQNWIETKSITFVAKFYKITLHSVKMYWIEMRHNVLIVAGFKSVKQKTVLQKQH